MAIAANDLRQFISEIWKLILDCDVEPLKVPREIDGEHIVGCVQITGAWRGTVVMEMPITLARKLTAMMMSLPTPSDATPELFNDALGELVNMFAGNVRAILPPPTYLSLPAVGPSRGFEIAGIHHRNLIELGFATCNESFGISISQVELDAPLAGWKPPNTPLRNRHPAARGEGSSILQVGDMIVSESK